MRLLGVISMAGAILVIGGFLSGMRWGHGIGSAETISASQDPAIYVSHPLATDEVLRKGEKTQAKVAAEVQIFPDGRAEGTFNWTTSADGDLIFQAVGGVGIFEGRELKRIEVEFMLNGELVTVTITPTTSGDDDIYDLFGSGVQGMSPSVTWIDAHGDIYVVEP